MTSSSSEDGFRVCLFELSGHSFGLRVESISQILPMAALSRPPFMPPILEGFVNLRGSALAVVRTGPLLGLPQDRLEMYTPLIVLRGGILPLALLVTRVTRIATVPAGGWLPIPASNVFNRCVYGRLTASDDAAYLLSPDRLLIEKEQRTVAEFHATETSRLHHVVPGPL